MEVIVDLSEVSNYYFFLMPLLTFLVSCSQTKDPVFVEPKLYPLEEKFFQTVLQFAYIIISLLFLFTNSTFYIFKLYIF